MPLKKKPLQVYLDRTDRALLERLARQLGLSRAEALRAAVRRWAMDLSAEDDPVLALIGSVDDPELPTDLSVRADEYAVAGYPKRRVAESGPKGASEE